MNFRETKEQFSPGTVLCKICNNFTFKHALVVTIDAYFSTNFLFVMLKFCIVLSDIQC